MRSKRLKTFIIATNIPLLIVQVLLLRHKTYLGSSCVLEADMFRRKKTFTAACGLVLRARGSGAKLIYHEMACKETDFIKAIKGAFDIADTTRNGFLTRKDYKIAITALLGYKPSKYETDRLLSEHGEDQQLADGSIVRGVPFEIFKSLMLPKMYQRDNDEIIRQIFLALDVQCRGFLTLEEVTQAFYEVIPSMPQDQVKQFFKEIDMDEDGRISYKDFELMMKQQKLAL